MTDPRLADLRWIRAVQQTRSRRTQAALLDAAERLFAEKGLDETSISDIAQEAGASVGALYHHFRDKSALFHAVVMRISEEMDATNRAFLDRERWEGAGIDDIARAYLAFAIKELAPSPVWQLLESPDLRGMPDLFDMIVAQKVRFYDDLAALMLEKRASIGHPEPDVAVRYAVEQLGAMGKWRAGSGLWSHLLKDVCDDTFVEETVRSISRYLRLTTP